MTATIHPIETIHLTLTEVIEDAGSVVIFEGKTDDGHRFRFGADHGPARDLIEAFRTGATVHVDVEPWQILGGPRHPTREEMAEAVTDTIDTVHRLAVALHEAVHSLGELLDEGEWVAMKPEEML